MIRLAALALVVMATFCGTAAADAAEGWTVGPAPSDHPDLKAATVTNADGHTLYLWLLTSDTQGEKQLFCELHLAEGTTFADRMPVYRIDDGAAMDTAEIRAAGEAKDALWGHVGEQVAFWLITPVPATEPAHEAALRPWLEGRELAITFRSADGGEQTTRFTLAGSAAAIRSATGVAPD